MFGVSDKQFRPHAPPPPPPSPDAGARFYCSNFVFYGGKKIWILPVFLFHPSQKNQLDMINSLPFAAAVATNLNFNLITFIRMCCPYGWSFKRVENFNVCQATVVSRRQWWNIISSCKTAISDASMHHYRIDLYNLFYYSHSATNWGNN